MMNTACLFVRDEHGKWQIDEIARRGRVTLRCSERRGHLSARFRLPLADGVIRGRAWGELRTSAGYE